MKIKQLLLTILLTFFSVFTYGQLEISMDMGYQFDNNQSGFNYDLSIYGNNYSNVTLSFMLDEYTYVGFSYQWIESNVYFKDASTFPIYEERTSARQNYYLIVAERGIPLATDRIQPFLAFQGGWLHATNSNPGTFSSGSIDRLSLGGAIGTRIFLTENIGLRASFYLNAPINGFGLGFYAGTGGSGVSTSAYSSMVFLGVKGGLFVQLGK